MQDFRSLKVWDKAHALTLSIYRATATFPRDEMFGLTSQLRRACASIPGNIAEGCGRGSDADFARFLQVAMGSASETDYHLLLARDLGYLETSKYDELLQAITEVKRMLNAFLQTVRRPILANSQ